MVPRGCYPSISSPRHCSLSLSLSVLSLLHSSYHLQTPFGHSSWSGAPNYTSRVTDEKRGYRGPVETFLLPLKRRDGPPRRSLSRRPRRLSRLRTFPLLARTTTAFLPPLRDQGSFVRGPAVILYTECYSTELLAFRVSPFRAPVISQLAHSFFSGSDVA